MSEPFDETAKTFLHRLFSSWGMKVETEREVFARARTLSDLLGQVKIMDNHDTVYSVIPRLFSTTYSKHYHYLQ